MCEWLTQSRTAEGREQLRLSGQLQVLTSEYSTGTDWKRRHQIMQCLKNSLISSEANALYLHRQRFLPEAIRHLDLLEDLKDKDPEVALAYSITALQFFANFVTSHESCAESFWEEVGGVGGVSRLLSLAISLTSDAALAAVIAILHSCLSKDGPAYQTRRRQVLEARQLCCQLALSLMDLQYSLTVAKDSQPTETPQTEQSLKWLHIFLLSLSLKGHSAELFRRVGPSSSVDSPSDHVALSHEQVIFLNVFTSVFEDPIFTNQTKIQLQAATPEVSCQSLTALESLVSDLATILTTPFLSLVHQAESSSFGVPLPFPLQDALVLSSVRLAPSLSHSLSIPSVPVVLDCLSACILAVDEVYGENLPRGHGKRDALRVQLSHSSVDDVCLRILAARRRNTTPSSKVSSRDGVVAPDREYWNTVVKSCLNLLMHLAHRCPSVQDTIRAREGLPVLLSYCATDFDNPLCREFALMCIRNLCEGNLENQRFIESLKPQQVLQDDSLLARGIRVEMDPSSGRFQFHHSSSPTGETTTESTEEGAREGNVNY